MEISEENKNMWKDVELQVDKTCVFVARQRENRRVDIEADVLHTEVLIHALQGAFGSVVVLAEMAKHDVFYIRMIDFSDETRCLSIAQMSKRSRDALLEDVRIGAVFQHILVVVRLDDDVFRSFDLFLHHIVEHPNVGCDGQRMAFKIKVIPHSATAIVQHRKRFYSDSTNLERLHGLNFVKQPGINQFCGFALKDTLQAIGMGVDWNGTIFGQRLKAEHMVDMIVGDQDGLYVAQRNIVFGQHLHDLLRIDAHVHENAFVLLAHIITIAATT